MIKSIFYVFLGGGVGSVLRFLISQYTSKMMNVGNFPVGTLIVNMVGCFLIGVFTAYFIRIDNALKFLLITGFCGGFTTFSTFAAENLSLWQNQQWGFLALYIILSVIGGIFAVYIGMQTIKN